MAKKLPPIHPGQILRDEFLSPHRLTPSAVAAALRLGKFFKTGAAFWMNIQARYDLETAEDVLAPEIKKIASYEAA